ncbi:hypothetical protein ACA910_000635 [Epithemia clementina (nom. ined.)]
MDSNILLEAECLDDYHKVKIIYHFSVAASVFLGFFSLCVRHVWLRELPGAPNLAFQFYCVIGILQIFIAIMLITVFVPHCAQACLDYCSNTYKPAYFVYPLIGTTLGVLLLREASRHRKIAQHVARHGDSDSAVFQAVPGSEVELQD